MGEINQLWRIKIEAWLPLSSSVSVKWGPTRDPERIAAEARSHQYDSRLQQLQHNESGPWPSRDMRHTPVNQIWGNPSGTFCDVQVPIPGREGHCIRPGSWRDLRSHTQIRHIYFIGWHLGCWEGRCQQAPRHALAPRLHPATRTDQYRPQIWSAHRQTWAGWETPNVKTIPLPHLRVIIYTEFLKSSILQWIVIWQTTSLFTLGFLRFLVSAISSWLTVPYEFTVN